MTSHENNKKSGSRKNSRFLAALFLVTLLIGGCYDGHAQFLNDFDYTEEEWQEQEACFWAQHNNRFVVERYNFPDQFSCNQLRYLVENNLFPQMVIQKFNTTDCHSGDSVYESTEGKGGTSELFKQHYLTKCLTNKTWLQDSNQTVQAYSFKDYDEIIRGGHK